MPVNRTLSDAEYARIADAIVDCTETGSSLRANKLRIVDTLMESYPQFIASKPAFVDPWKREKMERLTLLLNGALDITALGSATVLGLAVFAVTGFLVLQGMWRMGTFVFLACSGAWFINHALKQLFQRPRPDVVPHLREVIPYPRMLYRIYP